MVESFVPVWPSWDEVEKMVKEKGSAAPSKEIARNAKGQTEHEFFSDKLDRCAAALDDLTPEQKQKVYNIVQQFGHFHSCTSATKNNLVALVSVDDSDDDDDLPDSIAPAMRAEVQECRRKVLSWLAGHMPLYGERATATRWRRMPWGS